MTDFGIVSATIEEPFRGVWVADIVSTVAQESGVFDVLETPFRGTLIAPPVLDGAVYKARIVGGSHGLRNTLGFRQYRGSIPIATIARDAIGLCGETPGNIEASTRVDHFERGEASVARTLDVLASFVGGTWFVSRDGKTNFQTSRAGYEIEDDVAVTLAFDGADCEIVSAQDFDFQPGDTRGGRTVQHIRWRLDSDRLIAELRYDSYGLNLPPPLWYGRIFRGQVESQNRDYSVDVIVDSKFSMRSVPLMGPMKTIMNAGDLVSVGFYRGDPRFPYAINAERKTVDAGTLSFAPGSSGAVLTYTPPATLEVPIPIGGAVTTGTAVEGVLK